LDLGSPHSRWLKLGADTVNESTERLKKEHPLVRRIQRGDSAAWGGVYDLYARDLYRRILMPRLAQSTAAEDALSETFKAAIEKFEGYRDQGSGIYPWLSRIAHNKAMDQHRARAVSGRKIRDLTSLLGSEMRAVAGADELLENCVEADENKRKLEGALALLNPRYRQTLELRFLKGMSRQDCAKELKTSVATFDVVTLRALRALKKTWKELSHD